MPVPAGSEDLVGRSPVDGGYGLHRQCLPRYNKRADAGVDGQHLAHAKDTDKTDQPLAEANIWELLND